MSRISSASVWGLTRKTLEQIDRARANGIDVTIDQYPYGAGSSGISLMVPQESLSGGLQAFRKRITDEATAYKVFRGDLIRSIDLKCERFEFCPEITAKMLKRGERILELPVTFDARTVAEGKKIGYRDFVQAVWTLLKYRVRP